MRARRIMPSVYTLMHAHACACIRIHACVGQRCLDVYAGNVCRQNNALSGPSMLMAHIIVHEKMPTQLTAPPSHARHATLPVREPPARGAAGQARHFDVRTAGCAWSREVKFRQSLRQLLLEHVMWACTRAHVHACTYMNLMDMR